MTPAARLRFDRRFAFASALLVLALGLIIAVASEAAYTRQQLRELDIQARTLAQSVAAPLMFVDADAARENAAALAENPQVDAVGVYDQAGVLVASFQRPGAEPPPQRAEPYPGVNRGAYREVVRAVERDGQSYGAVYLRVHRDSLLLRLARYAPIALLVLMTALVLAVAGAAHGALSGANDELQQKARDLSETNAQLEAEMEQRKQAEQALLQSRKMEAIGQLTGGVAHDFNNLLMVVSGGLRMLERHAEPERRRKTMEAMQQAVERGAGLTRQLLAFARRQVIRLETVAVDERLSGMRELLERSLRADILLDISFPPNLPPVTTDPGQLELAVLNLCVNARDAMPKGGVITITAQQVERNGAALVEVLVRDTGSGIAPEILDRIFEPYFTTKPIGQGTGLGLSQVYGFAQQSGGYVRIDSQLGFGATVALALPVSKEALVRAAPAPAGAETQDARRVVLVVEDDDQVADMVCGMFEALGHEQRRARSAHEALDMIGANRDFDLVFSDIVMPGGKSGVELAADLKLAMPNLPVLLTTGYSGQDLKIDSPVLRKPYQLDELRAAIAAMPRPLPIVASGAGADDPQRSSA